MIFAYKNIDAVQFAVRRLLFEGDALEARVGTYKYISRMEGLHYLFGYGYGVVPPNNEYFAGAPYVWYGCGLVGFLLACSMFFSMFKNALSLKARTICVVFFVTFFVTSLFYNYMLFWYVTIIISTRGHMGLFERRSRTPVKERVQEDWC